MTTSYHSERKHYYFIICLLILWIILFEFILPPNQILPRPSITLLSFINLFRDYQFIINILSTVSALYFSAIAAGIVIWIFRKYILTDKSIFKFLGISLGRINRLVPVILIGLFLIIWFPVSEYSKYAFMFLISFSFLFNKAAIELKKVNIETIQSMNSLGADEIFIFEKISWKAIEPALAASLTELHYYLWSLLIVFEYINGGTGLGKLLRTAIQFKDLADLFVYGITLWILILFGMSIINYFKNKIFFWSVN